MGAIGAQFPNKISGLVGWYDASDYKALAIGTAVTTWIDKSGNANDLTRTGTAGITGIDAEGFPAIQTGSDASYYRKTGISYFTSTQEFTILTVMSRPTYTGTTIDTQTGHRLLYDGVTDAAWSYIQGNTNKGVRSLIYGFNTFSNGNYTPVGARKIVAGRALCASGYVTTFDNQGSPSPKKQSRVVTTGAFTNSCILTIAAGQNPGSSLGYHNETLVFNRFLTDAEFTDMIYYLTTKWNLT